MFQTRVCFRKIRVHIKILSGESSKYENDMKYKIISNAVNIISRFAAVNRFWVT